MILWLLTSGLAQAGTAQGLSTDELRLDWFTLEPTETFSPFRDVAYPTVTQVVAPRPIVVEVSPKPREVATPPSASVEPEVANASVVVEDTPPPEVPAVEDCAPASELEIAASTTGLSAEQHACMVDARASGTQVQRNRASRVMMRSAVKSGADLEPLLAYHLKNIDQSDPSLCLDYAGMLARRGRSVEAIRWTENALEVRNGWNGASFVEKVSRAYSLRAEMAHRRWTKIAKGPVDDGLRKREGDARALAKTAAREWLDYARSADLPTERANQLCASAAGTKRFCK